MFKNTNTLTPARTHMHIYGHTHTAFRKIPRRKPRVRRTQPPVYNSHNHRLRHMNIAVHAQALGTHTPHTTVSACTSASPRPAATSRAMLSEPMFRISCSHTVTRRACNCTRGSNNVVTRIRPRHTHCSDDSPDTTLGKLPDNRLSIKFNTLSRVRTRNNHTSRQS
jgi:hypothetical protein